LGLFLFLREKNIEFNLVREGVFVEHFLITLGIHSLKLFKGNILMCFINHGEQHSLAQLDSIPPKEHSVATLGSNTMEQC